MPTAVYLGNQRIQVLRATVRRGKVKVRRAVSIPLPEGVIINGVIIEQQLLRNELVMLRRRRLLPRRGLRLVVDSGNISVKSSVVPIMPHKKLHTVVIGEFPETINQANTMLYDYSVLSPRNPEGGATILCCAAERSLVESYLELFSSVRRKPESIRLGVDCTVKLCKALPELRSSSFVLMERDGNTLISSMFIEGRYLLSQRYRLISEAGTPEHIDELEQRISQLRQFNKSQNTGAELDKVLLCGFEDAAVLLGEELTRRSGLTVQPLHTGITRKGKRAGAFSVSEYCYTTGSLLC